MDYITFQNLNYWWMGLAVLIFILLLKVTAPYGRHTTNRWGLQISNRLGWVIMEVPGMAIILYFVLKNFSVQNAVTLTLVGFYLFHYINRTFVFPFRIHTRGKKMPLVIVLMAVCFNLVNGYLIGYYFGYFAIYTIDYFLQPNFIVGTLLFIWGTSINWRYDNRLIHLRKSNETGYILPIGGLFLYISCPNLFGEVVEWTGYAILCWNLPALSFLVWTVANLIPRALSHHRWYKQHFEKYPTERKAVLPYVW